jgi:hypothetical protein
MAFKTDRRKGDLVYLFDMSRGVEVLRIKKGAYHSKAMKAVTAPSVTQDKFAAQPVGALDASLTDNGGTSFICPLFL